MITDLGITLRLLFISVPTWLMFVCLRTIMIMIGWVLVPIAVWFGEYHNRKSRYYDKEVLSFTWPWMFPWGNEEDGIGAGVQYRDMGSLDKQIIYWSCLRNPVNNLRFVRWLSCDIDPERVRFTGTFGEYLSQGMFEGVLGKPPSLQISQYDTKVPQWFIAWCGVYSCWYWQFMLFGKLRRLWIGWKIYPTDVMGVTSYRLYGAGFATQFKVVK